MKVSRRKPKFEYQYMGEGYPDYCLILEGITAELEKLYHSLWDRRKEELEIRNIAKQVKTAWMLFKLESNDHVILEADGKYTNHHIFLDRKSRELYVNTRNLLRFEGNLQYPNSTNDRESESEISLNEWLMDLRRVKASKLMFSYLARTMMNWRDSKTRHYQGVLTAISTQVTEIHDFLKYGKTWADNRESIRDLEQVSEMLTAVHELEETKDEKDAWRNLFSFIERRYRWWYD